MYLALEGGPPSFPQDFSCPAVLRIPTQINVNFVYGAITRSGWPFQCHSTITLYRLLSVLQPRCNRSHNGLGCSAFARHYLRNNLFSSGYLDVSVPRVPRSLSYVFTSGYAGIPQRGFPHSDIYGSQL